MSAKLFIVTLILVSFPALNFVPASIQSEQADTNPAVSAQTLPGKTPQADGRVNFKGVSFNYNLQIFSEIKHEEIAEARLENETDKPDYIHPKHISISLKTTNQRENTIKIFPVKDYRRIWAAAEKNSAKKFDADLNDLKKVTENKNFRRDNEIPYLPFLDAHQTIKARVKTISFRNGKGFFFLTQYDQDYPSLINNEGLTYIFQGISDDGKKYILAEFSVRAAFLPKDYTAAEFEDYKLPSGFSADKANKKKYENYLAKITKRLENLPAVEFNPSLNSFEEIISSLKIEN